MFALVAALLSWSVIGAATTPGNEDFSAKWADWMRTHHAGSIVGTVERWYYPIDERTQQGWTAESLNSTLVRSAHRSRPPRLPTRLRRRRPRPPNRSSAAGAARRLDPLPQEGQWVATGPQVDAGPGMYVAQFRADTVYTSQITTAVWIDPPACA